MEEDKTCSCGYKLNSGMIEKFSHCTQTKALMNHVTFPSFEFLSDVNNPSEVYFKLEEDNLAPKRHWAFLIEIDENIDLNFKSFIGHSRYGEKVKVEFHQEPDDRAISFSWSNIKKGNTMAILYCEKKLLNGEMGIFQEVLDCCYIFNTTLDQLECETSKLLNHMDTLHLNKESQCFVCGCKKDDLIECEKCKQAFYCSKECLEKADLNGHQKICPDYDVLLRLACLPRHGEFMDYYSFVKKSFDYLPEFLFSENFIQKF